VAGLGLDFADRLDAGGGRRQTFGLLNRSLDDGDLRIFGVGDTGLEPVTPSLSSWCSPN
jgi:hypothetical protein